MAGEYNKVLMPSPLAPKKQKDSEQFGTAVARAILGATEEYRIKRNERIYKCRKYARGEQPVTQYLKQLSDDGKRVWNNIIYKPTPIASKYEKIVVNGYMEQYEYPKVTAMAKHIGDRRERRKVEAQYRMENQELIQALAAETGLEVEDPSAFVPRSIEELNIWWSLNDQEKEELLMQRMLTFTAEDIDIDALKKKILSEQFQAGLHGLYNYLDNNGRFRTDFIPAEDCIYDVSDTEDFRDINYAGKFHRMTISEIRSRWGLDEDKEEALFKAAMRFQGKFGNSSRYLKWNDSYRKGNRPYDNYTVELVHVWWKCSKVIGYIEGNDRYGREIFQTTDGDDPNSVKLSGDKYFGRVIPQTAYEGWFIACNEAVCLEWGEQRNIMRKGEDKEQVLCPYIFRMPGNKGDMMPISPIWMGLGIIMDMDILDLKMKTAVARSAPSGYAVDLDALTEVDLGEGVGVVDPLTIADIYRNTGFLYYRSKGTDGSPQRSMPIQPAQSNFDPQIAGLINLYNFKRQELRETWGINEFRDGSATSPRIGFRYAQSQLSQSNTATLDIYYSYLTSARDLFKQAGIRIWDSLAYGTPNKGYLGFLGKQDAEFIKDREDITASSYDIKFEMGMTLQDEEELRNSVNLCLTAGTLEMPDAYEILQIDDPKLARQVLSWKYEMRRRQRMEEAQQNAQMSANANAQAGQAVEMAKQQTAQIQIEGERAKERQRKDADISISLVKSGFEGLIESYKLGKPLTPELQALVDAAFQVSGVKAAKEIDDTEREMQARQQQDMIAAMEQQAAMQQVGV